MDSLRSSSGSLSVAADRSENSVRRYFKRTSQKVRLELSLVKDKIIGINSYNPMKNEKYRLLIISVMKAIKSQNLTSEIVEKIVDETNEDILVDGMEEENSGG